MTICLPSRLALALLLSIAGTAAGPARAQLIDANYTSGATLAPAGDDTGILVNHSTTFYGKTYSSIFLSTNGNLVYGNPTGPDSTPFPLSATPPEDAAIIAPLWDNWTTDPSSAPGTSIYFKTGPDRLEATWTVRHATFDAPNTNPISQFQAVLYNNGVIGFGYGDISGGQQTIRGLNQGDGIHHTDGSVFNEAQSNTQRFYRFDAGTGNYVVTAAPVPEPGLVAAFALGSLGGLLLRRQKGK